MSLSVRALVNALLVEAHSLDDVVLIRDEETGYLRPLELRDVEGIRVKSRLEDAGALASMVGGERYKQRFEQTREPHGLDGVSGAVVIE